MDKTTQSNLQDDNAGNFDWQRLLFLAMLAAWAFAISWAVTELLTVLTLKQLLAVATVMIALIVGALLRP